MSRTRKLNVKTKLAIVLTLILGILTFHIDQPFAAPFYGQLPIKDTVFPKKADSTLKDSMRQKVDTLKISKDSIDAPIKYVAEDSGVLIVSTREFFLYGKAKVDYSDLKLEAATIKYDQQTQIVKAYGALDTTGSPLSKPQFIQGEMKSVSDSILFNMKTGKGNPCCQQFGIKHHHVQLPQFGFQRGAGFVGNTGGEKLIVRPPLGWRILRCVRICRSHFIRRQMGIGYR